MGRPGGPIDYRWSKAVDPPERVKRSMGTMKRLYQRTQQVSLPVLVREVVDELRLVDIVLADNGGVQGAANVMRLVEQARHFSATGSGGLRQFAAWLARQREEEQEGDARIAEKADDAVLVTTYRNVGPNQFGGIDSWPEGFFDQGRREAAEILQAAMRKRARGSV